MNNVPICTHRPVALAMAALLSLFASTGAGAIPVVNASFEDTAGMIDPGNEFFFGQNPGWDFYNAPFIAGGNGANGIYTGTLEPAVGSPWFNGNPAPDGSQVAILFGFGTATSAGGAEYGLQQTLTGQVLEANTDYLLEVEVGNIAEGTATDGTFFPLGGFPGYRVELLAGGVAIAQDIDSLLIPEGVFLTSTVSFSTGDNHALLGQELGIRLVNLNNIPTGNDPQAPFDLEVDFDNVRLSAATIPEPTTLALLALGMIGLRVRRRRG